LQLTQQHTATLTTAKTPATSACNSLQSNATYCNNILQQHTATRTAAKPPATSALHVSATHCNNPLQQPTATTHCNTHRSQNSSNISVDAALQQTQPQHDPDSQIWHPTLTHKTNAKRNHSANTNKNTNTITY